jgi:hypothetical protein
MALAQPSQGGRVLSVEDWAEIRRLHRAEEMPIKAIEARRAVAGAGQPAGVLAWTRGVASVD